MESRRQCGHGISRSPITLGLSFNFANAAGSVEGATKSGDRMAITTIALEQSAEDRVSNVLKWVLFTIAICTFALLGWATDVTYQTAPPQPERFLAPDGAVLMSAADIQDGKASFQQADLMDYGSIYGMGSYFGEDYTAEYLVRLGVITADHVAKARYGEPFSALD